MAADGNAAAVLAAAGELPGGGGDGFGGAGSASLRLAELLGGERPLVGFSDKGAHSWRAEITINKKTVDLGIFFESRAQAAAAWDLALLWVKRHWLGDHGELLFVPCNTGRQGTHGWGIHPLWSMCDAAGHLLSEPNFLDLHECEELRATLQAVPDAAALKNTIADWMRVQWPQRRVALLAGRFEAMVR